ncbi:MAG TPA: WhiB family transcriptional regulator [Candidatus Saccharimonadales bacterium]|nr:WhiB family transcriptional regulator [Candidatus Saccharimonadales bacterium]
MRPTTDRSWIKDGSCFNQELTEVFYGPENGRTELHDDKVAREAKAKRICAGCIVARQCFEASDGFGIWAGLTEKERNDLLNSSNKNIA